MVLGISYSRFLLSEPRVAAQLVDLKKAFDTVGHIILDTKLDHYGIRGVAKQWLSSYLENRKQCFLHTACGVPQSSILGLSLFYCMPITYAMCLIA